jgi:hypothetical protein
MRIPELRTLILRIAAELDADGERLLKEAQELRDLAGELKRRSVDVVEAAEQIAEDEREVRATLMKAIDRVVTDAGTAYEFGANRFTASAVAAATSLRRVFDEQWPAGQPPDAG